LIEYARRAEFFEPKWLKRIQSLDQSEKIMVLAEAIMGRKDRGEEIFRPIPSEVVVYIRNQSVLWENFE
jgi:hypothetical protein